MSFADDITDMLPFLREQAESLMLDTCTVERPGIVVTDPVTGVDSQVLDAIYPTPEEVAAGNSGKCKTQQTISQAASPTSAGHVFTVQDAQLHLPVSAGPVRVDDVVTITASALDPHLVGNIYQVVELYEKSLATSQRLRVKQVTA